MNLDYLAIFSRDKITSCQFDRWKQVLACLHVVCNVWRVMAAGGGPVALLPNRCDHYIRRCALFAPCCGKIYPCRLCHDEIEEDHHLDRKQVNKIKCNQCGFLQAPSPRCLSCHIKFGLYYCEICRFFDDRDKGQFHCEHCGLCCVGGQEFHQHCTLCGTCFKIGSDHKCIEKCSMSDCPICLEDIHTSRDDCQKLFCGHMLHASCFRQLQENHGYRCPLCCQKI